VQKDIRNRSCESYGSIPGAVLNLANMTLGYRQLHWLSHAAGIVSALDVSSCSRPIGTILDGGDMGVGQMRWQIAVGWRADGESPNASVSQAVRFRVPRALQGWGTECNGSAGGRHSLGGSHAGVADRRSFSEAYRQAYVEWLLQSQYSSMWDDSTGSDLQACDTGVDIMPWPAAIDSS